MQSNFGSIQGHRYLRAQRNKAEHMKHHPHILKLPLAANPVHYSPQYVHYANLIIKYVPKIVWKILCLFVPTYRIISCIATNTKAMVLAAWKFF